MTQTIFSSALLVEDEPNLATALKIALAQLDIPTVQYASTLAEAKDLVTKSPPEFILLDRALPDGDGLDLCATLRKENVASTILILTASGKLEDRVHGLNLGADDYLPKPFSWEELEARIRALARRKTPFQNLVLTQGVQRPPPTRPLEIAPELWHLDEARLRILGPKGWVDLTPLEFKLAQQMILKQGEIVSRSRLLKEVWGFNLLTQTRTVDHFLGRLRKYFEHNPEEPCHFLTIRSAGYKFQY